MSATSNDFFLTIEELVQRLKMSEKTLRELAQTNGFPLRRISPHGTIYAVWSDVFDWLKKRPLSRKKIAS